MSDNDRTPDNASGNEPENEPGNVPPDEAGSDAAIEKAAGYDPHGQPGGGSELDVPAGEQHGEGGELEARFTDPGLPAHVHRRTDVDAKAAKRAERQVAALFTLSTLGTVLFCVAYFAIPLDDGEAVALSRLLTGIGLGLALFCIGAGAVHWAKKLMPDDEVVEERHAIASTPEERTAAAEMLREGGEATGFGRRPLIWGSMAGAMGALALPAIIPLRDLWIGERGGPSPADLLSTTMWAEGVRLVTDPVGLPVLASDIPIGGLVHVLPEGVDELEHPLEEKAKSAVLLIRLDPEDLQEDEDKRDWSYNGIVAYSKICTHMGCPVALYEQQTHHLLCPCHQSTFDVERHCKVLFGPAARPLPQLAITIDEEGYLVAQRGLEEPPGPSFWERG